MTLTVSAHEKEQTPRDHGHACHVPGRCADLGRNTGTDLPTRKISYYWSDCVHSGKEYNHVVRFIESPELV